MQLNLLLSMLLLYFFACLCMLLHGAPCCCMLLHVAVCFDGAGRCVAWCVDGVGPDSQTRTLLHGRRG